ncbi:MAG: histidine kinase N-terminal 7TM domain-containing protein, partial [Candidatus Hydrogenedentales bacterium]
MNHFSFSMWALFMSTLFALLLAAVLWRRRAQPGAVPLMVLVIAAGTWSFGEAAELASEGLAAKILWTQFRYIGIVTIPYVWVIFALIYAQERHWLTTRNMVLLGIIPLLDYILVWTNELHHLVWTEMWLHTDGSVSVMASERGV